MFKITMIKKDKRIDIGRVPKEMVGFWRTRKDNDPNYQNDPYEIEVEDVTAQYEAEQLEYKNKKEEIKSLANNISDANLKKIIKFLIRNIDNE